MTYIKAGKWFLKSAGGLVANLVLLTLWVDGFNLHPLAAIAINFVVISCAGYVLAMQWIFPDGMQPISVRGHLKQYIGMQLANATGKVGNIIIYAALLPVVDFRLAWLIGAVTTFGLTFGLNKVWWERSAVA